MLKRVVVLVICGVLTVFINCSSGKYGDVKDVMEDSIKYQQDYIKELKAAEKSEEFAEALLNFAENMVKIKKSMDELEKKYPELKNKKNPPAELVEITKKAEEEAKLTEKESMKLLSPKKMMKFAKDPKFVEAMKKFGEIMTN